MKPRSRVSFAVSFSVVLAACGGDSEDDGAAGAAGAAGGSGAAGLAGKGASAGSAGSGGSAGKGSGGAGAGGVAGASAGGSGGGSGAGAQGGGGNAGAGGAAGQGAAGGAGSGGKAGAGGAPGGSGGSAGGKAGSGGSAGGPAGSGGSAGNAAGSGGSAGDSAGSGGSAGNAAGAGGSAGNAAGAGGSAGAGLPTGWLYTTGNKIRVSDGNGSGTPWMGRGVNMDDIFLCGYNNTLWMPGAGKTLETMIAGLMTDWKPSFVRISLGMDSYPTKTSWISNPAQYKAPMTSVINAIGAYPNVYALVVLRSDASMIGHYTADPEPTGLPSDSTTTPNAAMFPTGTDAVYEAMVDTFANSKFVIFGLTNEPGGNKLSNAKIAAAMSHAVGVIRAREDMLGVPHHLVSVQGNGWTSDIGFYSTTPLPYDNVIYEVHGYPPLPSSYTYSNIPVIIGEYGTLTNAATFFADLETKQIPNLAWDFESYSDCSPDLLVVNHSATTLTPTAWGNTVKSYLLAHP